MKHVQQQPAYVLHRRSYRETSFLVDIFTLQFGRLTVLARGARKARSASPGLLQPFVPLLVSWRGNGELVTLTDIEPNGEAHRLTGQCLFAGFYLNELVIGLLHKWDAHASLYLAYAQALQSLQVNSQAEKTLRSFEKYLLTELGYGLLPASEDEVRLLFAPEKYYRFIPEQGFMLSELGDQSQSKANIFSGLSLLAIAKEDWSDNDILQDAKRLMRLVLTTLLGARQIHSRRLFMQVE